MSERPHTAILAWFNSRTQRVCNVCNEAFNRAFHNTNSVFCLEGIRHFRSSQIHKFSNC